MMTARERVEAVVAVAQRIADPDDELGREARRRLPSTSGLTPQGVELALTEHLEVAPSAADLVALVHAVTPAPRCHLVLSANVCTAPLRALACAVAASERVHVKPSRRDPVVAELLVTGLASPTVRIVEAIAPSAGDAVHVYGADETIATIAKTLPAGTTLLGHGTGFGVAIGEDVESIADDLVPFDGRGCLSPRVIVTAGDAAALGQRLHAVLLRRGEEVPRGPLIDEERRALALTRRTYETVGVAHVGPHHALFVDSDPQAVVLAPPTRAAVVLRCDVEHVAELFGPLAHHVTAVGGEGGALVDAFAQLCPRARRSSLGRMQRPPLDGPVDLR